ncbi:beta-ketoacyl-ACP synthase [uncultured Cocleimonas sp.]|uniref:beta-ketoacyl-ACP synthase n=1 Tax=uncultured Cocleimonas sp. TaxID=1051587 RepID=UPI002632B05B|nr:beta-ketoacyl-ACP synthase [uncultured Cocleimonas sp.]
MKIRNIRIVDYESTTAVADNIEQLRIAIKNQKSGLRKNDFPFSDLDTWIGRVSAIDDIDLGEWQSRNNAMAAYGLQQGTILAQLENLKTRFRPSRVGIIMGSSTSSIDRTETAYRHLDENGALTAEYQQATVHNPHGPGLFVAHQTGVTGPAITINTACSSSAKVFATGARWLQSLVVDAVLVGGVDTLCYSVLHGFDSLQLLSQDPCKPFDNDRDGINLGEASGYAILMRAEDCETDTGIELAGYGESSDAHHMSHPHPEGLGAKQAIESALTMAKLPAEEIDYINLHGTSSQANDSIEGKLIGSMFPSSTQCSSTKGWMAHTLGAAGITEALIAIDAARTDLIPGSLNLSNLDNELDFSITAENIERPLTHVMSNSFGFGGNNCCLVFSKIDSNKDSA